MLRPSFPRRLLELLAAAAITGCAESAAPTGESAAAAADAFDVSDAAPRLSADSERPGTLRDAVLYWNDAITKFFHAPVFVPGQPPPADARGYAMASVAIHDVLNAIDRRYEPLIYRGTVSSKVSGQAAIAAAVRGVLVGLGSRFATTAPSAFAEERYQTFLAGIADGPEKTAGIALGEAVAAAILADRATDGSVAPPATPFTSAGGPGDFRPIAPNPVGLSGVAAIQHWGRVRPFVLTSPDQFRSGSPYGAASLAAAVQTPAYLADYAETKRLGGVTSERTQDQTDIAFFWIESSAQGWNRVARTILARRPQTAWRTARFLAQLHLALADGYIANFESKYFWKFWRPVTAIRLGNLGASDADPTWNVASSTTPIGGTPPIPEWPSAHAMGGAAAAEVILAHVRGSTGFTMETTTLPGKPRTYRSVQEAVRDNNLSRIYVGYHWRSATVEGELQGRRVGRYIVRNALQRVRHPWDAKESPDDE